MATNWDGRNSSTSSYSSVNTPIAARGTPKKRPRGTVSLNSSTDDKHTDFSCPICFNLIEEAYIAKCGHTFCYTCLIKSIEASSKCPKCNFCITKNDIFPNFLLNDIIKKHKNFLDDTESTAIFQSSSGEIGSTKDGLRDLVTVESQNLSLPDVNVLLEVLTQRKLLLEAESYASQNRLLLEFLRHLLRLKKEKQTQICREISVIESDINEVTSILKRVQNKCTTFEDLESNFENTFGNDSNNYAVKKEIMNIIDHIGTSTDTSIKQSVSFDERRRRMHVYFNDFVDCYLSLRSQDLLFGKDITNKSEKSSDSTLDKFRESLVKFSNFSCLKVIATLNYSNDLFNNSTIVSSIEFDRDNEFFAIAGVTKRIKVFDYNLVIKDLVNVHHPCCEMISRSKISCVSWHTYHKNLLASSDYEGTVTVWDASTSQRTKTFQEHERRCWSVDFNAVDTRLIASGSDDARVKLYSLNEEHSVATLEAKANVCCVKFNPKSSTHLAFGSADHCVHYYDLRNMKEPVTVFKGHKKAVSYVKFLNSKEIISASTDSQLKMWDINTPHCLRSFEGHTNDKNFVGLATDGDYIACGSENNALYVYYKGFSKKLLSYKFEAVEGILEQERREDDMNEFVSAVCWKQNANVIVAANSRGIINILELI